jgi:hypothetical protein
MENIPILPRKKEGRIIDAKYMCNGKIVIWNGKKLKCPHLKNPAECAECGGSQVCVHKKMRHLCKECGGCGICEHGKRRTVCKNCGGGSLCEHDKLKEQCKVCGGSQICEHKISRYQCRLCGGNAYCHHNKLKNRCIDCGGSAICKHKKRKDQCKQCNPRQHLINIIRQRISDRLKNYSKNNKKHTMEYVGCNLDTLKEHIEKQFNDGMTWENQGKWHIDHIRPCASFNLDKENERHMCFHYTNLQPLWAFDNISKSSSYDEKNFNRNWVIDHWE